MGRIGLERHRGSEQEGLPEGLPPWLGLQAHLRWMQSCVTETLLRRYACCPNKTREARWDTHSPTRAIPQHQPDLGSECDWLGQQMILS